MDGFKDSTKTKYMMGGDVKAYKTGGVVKKMALGGMPAGASATVLRPPIMSGSPNAPTMQPAAKGPRHAASTPATSVSRRAKGGAVKMSEGGTYNEKGKRATLAEIAAEGRRVEGRKPPVEGISTRPTDDSGRRMTDKELGMTPGGVAPKKKAMPKGMGAMSDLDMERAKKKAMPKVMSDLERARMMARPLPRKEGGGVPAHSDRPMIRRKTGGLAAMPGKKC
jgi:hypothetical protein